MDEPPMTEREARQTFWHATTRRAFASITEIPSMGDRNARRLIILYLARYNRHQWFAASRGLLPGITIDDAVYTPEDDELTAGEHRYSNVMVVGHLLDAQHHLELYIAKLELAIAEVQGASLLARYPFWLKTIVLAFSISTVLASVVWYSHQLHSQPIISIPSWVERWYVLLLLLHRSPAWLKAAIPHLPLALALCFLIARERRIVATEAVRARLRRLDMTVKQGWNVPEREIQWLNQNKWPDVDFDLVGTME